MAEERIKGIYFKGCNTKCDAVFDLTRQEAIERMAKGICLTYSIGDECDCRDCDMWKYHEQHAEAALNALLEAQNER